MDPPAENSAKTLKRPSCDACHRKKSKCTGPLPCHNCIQSGIPCTTDRVIRKRGPKSKEYMHSLEIRVQEVESLLTSFQKDSSGNYKKTGYEKHQEVDNASLSTFESDSSNKLGASSLGSSNAALNDPIQYLPRLSHTFDQMALDAHIYGGHADLRMDLLISYFDCVYPYVPCMPRQIFFKCIRRMSPLLITSMYALAAIYAVNKPETAHSTYSAGMSFYEEAKRIVGFYMEDPSICTIHALINLGVYASCIGKPAASSTYFGMATKMAVDMTLYEPNDIPIHELRDLPQRLITEVKNRTWWICYIADVATEASSGKPSYAVSVKETIPLPSNEKIWDLEAQELELYDTYSKPQMMTDSDILPGSIDFQCVFSLGVAMYKIYWRLSRYLRDLEKNKRSTEELNVEHITLEASLSAWYLALPSWMRSPHNVVFTASDMKCAEAAHWVCAYFLSVYHACIIMLQRSRLPRTSEESSLRSVTAYSKTLEAARSITYLANLFLRDNPQYHHVCPFFCFFLFEAGMAWTNIARLDNELMTQSLCDQGIVTLIRSLDKIATYFITAESLRDSLKKMRAARSYVQAPETVNSHFSSNTSLNIQNPAVTTELRTDQPLSFMDRNQSPGNSIMPDVYSNQLPVDHMKMNMISMQTYGYDRITHSSAEPSITSQESTKTGSLSSFAPPLNDQDAREIQESLNAFFNLPSSS